MLGVTEGPHFPAMSSSISNWLTPNERARALSFGLVAIPLSSFVGAPITSYLVASFGWRAMFFIVSVIGIVWAAVWYWLFRNSPNDSSRVNDAEKEYIAAEKENIDLKAILDGKVDPTGEQLYLLAKHKAATIHADQASNYKLDLKAMLKDDKTVLTPEQYQTIKEHKLITTAYPKFAGFVIHDLFEFFMVFVVLCGIASVLLFAISPKLKTMMHGIV